MVMAGAATTQLADVMICLYDYLNIPKDLWRLIDTSRSVREACSHLLADDVEAGKRVLLAAVNKFLRRSINIIKSDGKSEYLLGKWLETGSNACRTRIRFVLRACGSMLLDSSLAADIAVAVTRSIHKFSYDRTEVTKAAAYLYSCLLPGGLIASYSEILAICSPAQQIEHQAAWISAHGGPATTAMRFAAGKLEAYGLVDNDDNQQALTAAVVAIVRKDVGALAKQLHALSTVQTKPNSLLLADLVLIVEGFSPQSSSTYGLIRQAVCSDASLLYLTCQALHQFGLKPYAKRDWILDLPAIRKLPAKAQQCLKLLVEELMDIPLEVFDLLKTTEASANKESEQLHDQDTSCAVAAAMQRCIEAQPPNSARLFRLCDLYGGGHGSRVMGRQYLSRQAVADLLVAAAAKLTTCKQYRAPRWCSYAWACNMSNLSSLSRLKSQLRFLCSLAKSFSVDDSLLITMLGTVAAPGSGVHFVAVLKVILSQLKKKPSLEPGTAAKILELAKATQDADHSSNHVPFAAAFVLMEFPQLRMSKPAATATAPLPATSAPAAHPAADCSMATSPKKPSHDEQLPAMPSKPQPAVHESEPSQDQFDEADIEGDEFHDDAHPRVEFHNVGTQTSPMQTTGAKDDLPGQVPMKNGSQEGTADLDKLTKLVKTLHIHNTADEAPKQPPQQQGRTDRSGQQLNTGDRVKLLSGASDLVVLTAEVFDLNLNGTAVWKPSKIQVAGDYMLLHNVVIADQNKAAASSVTFCLDYPSRGIKKGKTPLWQKRGEFNRARKFVLPVPSSCLVKV